MIRFVDKNIFISLNIHGVEREISHSAEELELTNDENFRIFNFKPIYNNHHNSNACTEIVPPMFCFHAARLRRQTSYQTALNVETHRML